MGFLLSKIVFQAPYSSYSSDISYFQFIPRSDFNQIPIRYYCFNPKLPTIIYSHGNAEDIGHINLENLVEAIGCNIMIYDYSGYGIHTCRNASEANCYEDILGVYNYARFELHLSSESIFILGRSLGSGPSCYLAEYCARVGDEIGGLILISPFLSITQTKTSFSTPGDMFKNYLLAPSILAPTLIIHGNQDIVIPYQNGERLSHLFGNTTTFLLRDRRGHNDILDINTFDSIKEFINI